MRNIKAKCSISLKSKGQRGEVSSLWLYIIKILDANIQKQKKLKGTEKDQMVAYKRGIESVLSDSTAKLAKSRAKKKKKKDNSKNMLTEN